MDNIDGSKTSHSDSLEVSQTMKAASAPICLSEVPNNETQLTTQVSAPSYLFSLKENESPPFKKPGKEAKPILLIGTIMNEQEAIQMVAAADANKENGLKKWLTQFLVEKKIILKHNVSEKQFLLSLLREVIDYAAQCSFSALKLSVLITIYLATHLYFKWYYWISSVDVWCYFKETMIRHTIVNSPCGEEVFEPEECYDILTHFHTVYMSNLPLVHIVMHGVYRLKLQWPFNIK